MFIFSRRSRPLPLILNTSGLKYFLHSASVLLTLVCFLHRPLLDTDVLSLQMKQLYLE